MDENKNILNQSEQAGAFDGTAPENAENTAVVTEQIDKSAVEIPTQAADVSGAEGQILPAQPEQTVYTQPEQVAYAQSQQTAYAQPEQTTAAQFQQPPVAPFNPQNVPIGYVPIVKEPYVVGNEVDAPAQPQNESVYPPIEYNPPVTPTYQPSVSPSGSYQPIQPSVPYQAPVQSVPPYGRPTVQSAQPFAQPQSAQTVQSAQPFAQPQSGQTVQPAQPFAQPQPMARSQPPVQPAQPYFYGQNGYYQPPYQYYGQPQKKPAHGLAVAAMVCGIVGIAFCASIWLGIILGALAVIFGFVARSNGNKGGQSLSGIIMGFIALGLSLIFIMSYIDDFGYGEYYDYDDYGESYNEFDGGYKEYYDYEYNYEDF